MKSSDLFRLFVKDFIDPRIPLPNVRKKWNATPGLFKALKENMDAFPMFGISISDSETEPDLYISLTDNEKRLKFHNGQGIPVYPGNNIVEI